MSIFRVIKDKDNPYVIKNTFYDFDSRLSLKAKGLMGIFLSRPDNWEFYNKEILKHCKDGKDSLNTAINELIKNGYIERTFKRDKAGKLLGGYNYSVYEMPKEYTGNLTCTKSTEIGKTEIGKTRNRKNTKSGNPPLLNNELKLNNEKERDTNSQAIELLNYAQKLTGRLGIFNLAALKLAIDKYDYAYTKMAIEKAIEVNKCDIKYINGILKTWAREGYPQQEIRETKSSKIKKFDLGDELL